MIWNLCAAMSLYYHPRAKIRVESACGQLPLSRNLKLGFLNLREAGVDKSIPETACHVLESCTCCYLKVRGRGDIGATRKPAASA